MPDYWDTRYDPLWTAIQDADLPVCLHIGLKLGLEDVIKRDPTPQRGIFIPMVPLATAEALGMWVLTGVLERHRCQAGLRARHDIDRLHRCGGSRSPGGVALVVAPGPPGRRAGAVHPRPMHRTPIAEDDASEVVPLAG